MECPSRLAGNPWQPLAPPACETGCAMTKIADIHDRRGGEPIFICDFSPPRGAAYGDIDSALSLNAHCLSVPYNPGKSVYANSAIAARAVKSHTGKDVAFTIATRDMNILAAQSPAPRRSLARTAERRRRARRRLHPQRTAPHKTRPRPRAPQPSSAPIAAMNQGIDFRGRPPQRPDRLLRRRDHRHQPRDRIRSPTRASQNRIRRALPLIPARLHHRSATPIHSSLRAVSRRASVHPNLLWYPDDSPEQPRVHPRAALSTRQPPRGSQPRRHRHPNRQRLHRSRHHRLLPNAPNLPRRHARLPLRRPSPATLPFVLSLPNPFVLSLSKDACPRTCPKRKSRLKRRLHHILSILYIDVSSSPKTAASAAAEPPSERRYSAGRTARPSSPAP